MPGFDGASVGKGVSFEVVDGRLEFGSGWTSFKLMSDAKILALVPNISVYYYGLEGWFDAAIHNKYIASSGIDRGGEQLQYQSYIDAVSEAHERLTAVGHQGSVTNHDAVLLAFIKLDIRLRQRRYASGCSWDKAFDAALLSSAHTVWWTCP